MCFQVRGSQRLSLLTISDCKQLPQKINMKYNVYSVKVIRRVDEKVAIYCKFHLHFSDSEALLEISIKTGK